MIILLGAIVYVVYVRSIKSNQECCTVDGGLNLQVDGYLRHD
jgi:hypothetical protein